MTLKEIFLPWLVVREQRCVIERQDTEIHRLLTALYVQGARNNRQPRDSRGRFTRKVQA